MPDGFNFYSTSLSSRVYQEEGDDEIDLWLKVIADKNDGVSCMSSRVYQEEGDDEIDLWLKVIADKRMAFHDCFTRVPGGGWR